MVDSGGPVGAAVEVIACHPFPVRADFAVAEVFGSGEDGSVLFWFADPVFEP